MKCFFRKQGEASSSDADFIRLLSKVQHPTVDNETHDDGGQELAPPKETKIDSCYDDETMEECNEGITFVAHSDATILTVNADLKAQVGIELEYESIDVQGLFLPSSETLLWNFFH
jgi:hypothetical protein